MNMLHHRNERLRLFAHVLGLTGHRLNSRQLRNLKWKFKYDERGVPKMTVRLVGNYSLSGKTGRVSGQKGKRLLFTATDGRQISVMRGDLRPVS